MRHKTSNLTDEERDDMIYSCQQAVEAIHTWKAHQLRVLQQDKCRIDVLQELKFSEVLITQDWAMMAACPLMQKTTGINVRRVDFSDPQGGKGSCDRKAATIKAHVRRFVNEGHDVLTADDLRDAILSNNGVRGVRVAVVNCEFLAPAQPVK